MHNTHSIIATLEALTRDESVVLSDRARERLQWLLHYYRSGSSVSDTCRTFDIARVTFYRLLQRFDIEHPETLEDKPSFVSQPTVSESTIGIIRAYRLADPLAGKERVAHLLLQDHGIRMSASLVGKIITREGLFFATTPLHRQKRLQYGLYAPENISSDTTFPPSAEKNNSDSSSYAHGSAGHCLYCHVRVRHGRRLKRTFVAMSIFTNIAVAGLILLTAFIEGQTQTAVAERPSLESTLLQP